MKAKVRTRRNSFVRVFINKNYTATVYNLDDLKYYLKREKIDPSTIYPVDEQFNNEDLQREIIWFIKDHTKATFTIEREVIGEEMNHGKYKKIYRRNYYKLVNSKGGYTEHKYKYEAQEWKERYERKEEKRLEKIKLF